MFPYGFQWFIIIIIGRQSNLLVNNINMNTMDIKRHMSILFFIPMSMGRGKERDNY